MGKEREDTGDLSKQGAECQFNCRDVGSRSSVQFSSVKVSLPIIVWSVWYGSSHGRRCTATLWLTCHLTSFSREAVLSPCFLRFCCCLRLNLVLHKSYLFFSYPVKMDMPVNVPVDNPNADTEW